MSGEERRARRGRGRGAQRQLVLFRVAGVTYGLPIERVRMVVNPLPVIELPHAPPAIIGVCDHRGEVVPVIDLRIRFGLPPLADRDAFRRVKWILFDASGVAAPALAAIGALTGMGGADPRAMSLVPSSTPSRVSHVPGAARGAESRAPDADADVSARVVAIVVDEVRDVMPVHEALRPPPPLGPGESMRGIVGVVSSEQADRGIIFVLDVERLRALTDPIADLIAG